MIKTNKTISMFMLSFGILSGMMVHAGDNAHQGPQVCDDQVQQVGRLEQARAVYNRYTPYSHYAAAGLAGAAAFGCYVKREALKNGLYEAHQAVAPLGTMVCDLGSAVKHGVIGGAYLIAAAGKLSINTLSGLAAVAKGVTEFVREEPKLVAGLTVGGAIGWYAHKWCASGNNRNRQQPTHEFVVRPLHQQPAGPQQNNLYF